MTSILSFRLSVVETKTICYDSIFICCKVIQSTIATFSNTATANFVLESEEKLNFMHPKVTVGYIKDVLEYNSSWPSLYILLENILNLRKGDKELTVDGDISQKVAKFSYLG